MPVQFLSDEQARRYGSFHGDPSAEQLSRFFSFGPAEQEDIDRHRDDRSAPGLRRAAGLRPLPGLLPRSSGHAGHGSSATSPTAWV